ncbi:hypothetical protein MLD38_036550 [Melastoma candidum]|uniref:Uncharacterized protein n=1 Tax=Melastoma candidum TaxID=119954 RepID=A0ACB9LKS3_9MYRT|nr:hypothetical protein MLD38_036550 [Melastoma candidum]
MKLSWCPERASKAYIDTITYCKLQRESGPAELVSAMAAGWNARLIVETWFSSGAVAVSMGLAVASRHTGGRHVCVVSDEDSRSEYLELLGGVGLSAEVMVGDFDSVVSGLPGIDFMVVDCQRRDFTGMLQMAELGEHGAVLVCKNASVRISSSFRWRSVLDSGSTRRLVRSSFIPVGKGLDIAYVAANGESLRNFKGEKRWIKRLDRHSGEEVIIRK